MGIYFTPKQDTIMKKLCFILLLYAFCLLPLAAQHPPKHEVRAAWITASVSNKPNLWKYWTN